MMLNQEESFWVQETFKKNGMLDLFGEGSADAFIKKLIKKSYPVGSKVVVEGDPGDFVYLIRSGKADVCIAKDGELLPVRTLGEGEFFGEIAVVTRSLRKASVIASDDLETYLIFKEDFRGILSKNPELATWFHVMIHKRNEEIKEFLASLTFLGRLKHKFWK